VSSYNFAWAAVAIGRQCGWSSSQSVGIPAIRQIGITTSWHYGSVPFVPALYSRIPKGWSWLVLWGIYKFLSEDTRWMF